MTGFKVASFGSVAKASTLIMDTDIANPFGYGFKGEGFRVVDTTGNEILNVDGTTKNTSAKNILAENICGFYGYYYRLDAGDDLFQNIGTGIIGGYGEEIKLREFYLDNLLSSDIAPNQSIKIKINLTKGSTGSSYVKIYKNGAVETTIDLTGETSGVAKDYEYTITVESGDVIKITYYKQTAGTFTFNKVDLCATLTEVVGVNDEAIVAVLI